jgi:short-chain Z-isoprenyl diphosphate synthase
MDGNRRWARQAGFDNVGVGHRRGAEHVEDLLGWCSALGITHVTVFVASADNLGKREREEVDNLMDLCERVVAERLVRPESRWQVHVAGRRDLLPDSTQHALKLAEEATRDRDDQHLTIAIGYDGRAEVVDAVRAVLHDAAAAGEGVADVARRITAADIAARLYTSGRPDPDLVIRTSGERRLSNFLIWQSATSELYFCEMHWPAFREVDFLRALRSYAARRSGEGKADR